MTDAEDDPEETPGRGTGEDPETGEDPRAGTEDEAGGDPEARTGEHPGSGTAAGDDEHPAPRIEDPDAPEDVDLEGGQGGERPREGPLADVAGEVERLRQGGPEDVDPDLFEEVAGNVDVDRETLWRQVAGEEVAERVAEADPELDPAAVTGPRVDPEDRTERIVEKKKYCQNCEHFSPPPDVHCTHEGTEIAEMVDIESFRVIDCPVVAEDEELERF